MAELSNNLFFGIHLYLDNGYFILPSNFSQIAEVFDFHFQDRMFQILLFCCNSKTVEPRS